MENFKSEKLNFQVPSGTIAASLLSTSDSTDAIAVALPGAGYPCSMPLLYYSIDALLLKGYQVLSIDKDYADDMKWRNLTTREAAFQYVEDDTVELFAQIAKIYQGRLKVLIGRSLGTFQIACAIERKIVKPQQIVWQSPSLYERWPIIRGCGIPGLGIIGTKDQRYEIAIQHFPSDRIVIEGADHAMEIPGDLSNSILALEKIIRTTNDWLLKP